MLHQPHPRTNLEVKVTDFKSFMLKFLVKVSRSGYQVFGYSIRFEDTTNSKGQYPVLTNRKPGNNDYFSAYSTIRRLLASDWSKNCVSVFYVC